MPENDGCGLLTLLDVPAFHLECANVNGECELAPQPHAFRMLTALAGLLLSWQGDAIELKAGDSVLLPASCPPVTLMGVGQALISTPARAFLTARAFSGIQRRNPGMKACSKGTTAAACLGYALITAALFWASPYIRPEPSTGVFLAAFSAASLWACKRLRCAAGCAGARWPDFWRRRCMRRLPPSGTALPLR